MSEAYTASSQLETVVCSGNKDNIPHPKVYLKINADTHCVTCPYCYQKICVDSKQDSGDKQK